MFPCVLRAPPRGRPESAAPAYADKTPKRYPPDQNAPAKSIRARASTRGFRFVFQGKGRQGCRTSSTRRRHARGAGRRLVIWMMGYGAPLFDRLGGRGLHAIQVHYANKWFGFIPKTEREDGNEHRQDAARGRARDR